MEKSGKVIVYEAYVRYLRKVTGRPAGAGRIRADVRARTVDGTEIRMVWVIMKKILYVSSVVFLLAVCAAALNCLSVRSDPCPEEEIWTESRDDPAAHEGRLRLYDAYEHSSMLRNVSK